MNYSLKESTVRSFSTANTNQYRCKSCSRLKDHIPPSQQGLAEEERCDMIIIMYAFSIFLLPVAYSVEPVLLNLVFLILI